MQLPDTDNIHFQYAFKTGYRMAIDGKRVTSMPSNIRRDMQMRDYFQQGWQQALEDISLAQQSINKPNWRTRFIWFAFMLLGGIATASLMINNIESEIAAQQAVIKGENNQNQSSQPTVMKAPAANQPVTQSRPVNPSSELSILTAEQRHDLVNTKVQEAMQTSLPLEPIIASPIRISQAVFSEHVEARLPVNLLDNDIPKYIRQVFFFTQIKHANDQTLYHRWRTENQILATVKLNIQSDNFRTWSSKKLSSAWQGQWYVEVLDSNQQVIFRKSFYYGSK